MSVASRWNLRAENDCLFVDDISLGVVVLQHNAPTGHVTLHPSAAHRGRQYLPDRG